MAVIGYKRVSSVDQKTDRQLDGVALDEVFEDKCSGKDRNRPALTACLRFCRKGDTLRVHSLDRLGRNASDLLNLVKELTDKGVTVEIDKPYQMTFKPKDVDPMADLMFTMLAGFAQFERAMILERQREGIAKAKDTGKYRGRKPVLEQHQILDIRKQVEAGVPKAKIARHYGISRAALYVHLGAS